MFEMLAFITWTLWISTSDHSKIHPQLNRCCFIPSKKSRIWELSTKQLWYTPFHLVIFDFMSYSVLVWVTRASVPPLFRPGTYSTVPPQLSFPSDKYFLMCGLPSFVENYHPFLRLWPSLGVASISGARGVYNSVLNNAQSSMTAEDHCIYQSQQLFSFSFPPLTGFNRLLGDVHHHI